MAELFDAVTEWDNLWQAFSVAARGKRRKGSAAAFEQQVADRLVTAAGRVARQDLSARAPIATSSFTSRSVARSVPRRFADRVVHHALCNG
jgi:hypothetical protein